MKKHILYLILLIIVTTFHPMGTSAQTPSDTAKMTPSPTGGTSLLNQINSLKDKIASKVAELNLVEKRGVIGTVSEVTSTQITILDLQDEKRFIDVDEITKFSAEDEEDDFGISDLKQGTVISVLGLYNKESRRLLARFVNTMELPVHVVGTIKEIDRPGFTITVEDANKKQYIIDIENYTKSNSYSVLDTDPTRIGFSKISQDEKVMIIGTPNKTEKNRLHANRILVFPDFSGSAEVLQPAETSPSPTKRATSPAPTRRPTATP